MGKRFARRDGPISANWSISASTPVSRALSLLKVTTTTQAGKTLSRSWTIWQA
jgi:hypothetical protein